jgi:phosphoglycolate phosphatase-like HAD superfamily hydrolase
VNQWVVFDLDGTLNKMDEDGVEVFQKTLDQLGIDRFSSRGLRQQFGARPKDISTYLLKGSRFCKLPP